MLISQMTVLRTCILHRNITFSQLDSRQQMLSLDTNDVDPNVEGHRVVKTKMRKKQIRISNLSEFVPTSSPFPDIKRLTQTQTVKRKFHYLLEKFTFPNLNEKQKGLVRTRLVYCHQSLDSKTKKLFFHSSAKKNIEPVTNLRATNVT